MIRKTLLAALLIVFTPMGVAQTYHFHADIQGIYWNPELAGWGFSFDVQKGVLFGAVYGYDDGGEPTFYTLISEQATLGDNLDFSGQLFVTRANGSDTNAAGTFSASFGRNNGQPALRITMQSPSLNLDDFVLIRFAYAEADRVSVLSGAQVKVWFGDQDNGQNQSGDSWIFSNNRGQVDGQVTVDVADSNGNIGFSLLSESGTYAVFFPQSGGNTLTYDFDLLNSRGGQGIRFVFDDAGAAVGAVLNTAAIVVALDESSTKAPQTGLSVAAKRSILNAYATYRQSNPRSR
ncbi:MAG: hypothetical protein AAGA23_02095 [Pseudomonadota bacterium]